MIEDITQEKIGEKVKHIIKQLALHSYYYRGLKRVLTN